MPAAPSPIALPKVSPLSLAKEPLDVPSLEPKASAFDIATKPITAPRVVRNQDFKDVGNIIPELILQPVGSAVSQALSIYENASGKESGKVSIPVPFPHKVKVTDGDYTHMVNAEEPIFDAQGIQRYHGDLLRQGVDPDQAYAATKGKALNDAINFLLIGREVGKYGLLKAYPEKLVTPEVERTVKASREAIRDYVSGRAGYEGQPALPKEIETALKNANGEEKIQIMKSAGVDVMSAKPSTLGAIFGVSPEEAKQLLSRLQSEVRPSPSGALPGYKRGDLAPAFGMSTERRVPVGFGEDIPEHLKPLAEEAKKYKTADEFIKSQELLYHGTSEESAARIKEAGGFRPGGEAGLKDLTGLTDVKADGPVSLTMDENTGKLYSEGPRPDGSKGALLTFSSKNLNIASPAEAKRLGLNGPYPSHEKFLNNLKEAGYDGYHTSSPHDEMVETVVVNKEKLKLASKSDLADLHAKVAGQSPTLSDGSRSGRVIDIKDLGGGKGSETDLTPFGEGSQRSIGEASADEISSRYEQVGRPAFNESAVQTALDEMTQADILSEGKAKELKNQLRSPDLLERQEAEAEMARLEQQFAEEAARENPARKLAKFESKKGDMQGRLPEVTGKGPGKFAKTGDEITSELGFQDTEEARAAYDKYKEDRRRIEIRKEAVSAKVKDIRDRKAVLAALRKEVNAEARSRISRIRAIQNFFHLTDTELNKIMGMKGLRSAQLMTDKQFADFIKGMEGKAAEQFVLSNLRMEIKTTIFEKELVKTDNLRRAMHLPEIENMSTSQLKSFNTILKGFEKGDEFLGPRQIETVRHTDIAGIKTMREARAALAKETGVDPKVLSDVRVIELDRFRYDTALARQNPLFQLMVEEKNRAMLEANFEYHHIKTELTEKIKAARASRKRSIIDRLVPTDERIFRTLEMDPAQQLSQLDVLTREELDAVVYIKDLYLKARDHLAKADIMHNFRQNYITHLQRDFLETWKDDGLVAAFKGALDRYKQDEAYFNILDQKTKEVLPLEKFFQFSVKRFEQITPTKNVARAVLAYFQAFEKKKALDSLIPKIDIYTHSLSPKKLTPRGLEFDDSLKRFVREWLNTKKGRVTDVGFVKPGGQLDFALRGIVSLTRLLDLGLSVPVGLASNIGEQVTSIVSMGVKDYGKGVLRLATPKGRAITHKYSNFVGETFLEQVSDITKSMGDKVGAVMFGLFASGARRANQVFLLGSLTPAEWAAGEISAERLGKLNTVMGKYRVVEGAASILGSTSVGSVGKQYKSWAVPIISSTISNIEVLIKGLRQEGLSAINPKTNPESAELLRSSLITAAVVFTFWGFYQDEKDKKASDRTFIEQLAWKGATDALSLISALDPTFWTAAPRAVQFLTDLGSAGKKFVLIERNKAGELTADDKLKSTLTPALIRQFKNLLPDPVNDLKDRVASQKTSTDNLTLEAEALDESLQKLSPAEANKRVTALKEDDPELYKKLKTVFQERKGGLTQEERLIKQLHVKDGARARYIDEQAMKIHGKDSAETNTKRKAYLKDLADKGILTPAVFDQVKDIRANGESMPTVKDGAKEKDATILDRVETYAKAIGTDPVTAFNRIFTGQSIRRIDNGAIIVERMPLKDSEEEAHRQLLATSTPGLSRTMVRLDHTVPLELGGSNTRSNLRLVTADEWAHYTPIENLLGQALDDGKIKKARAQDLIRRFKKGEMTAGDVRQALQ